MKPPAFVVRIVRYKCGTCGSDRIDYWSVHQHHYEKHQREGKTDGQ